MAIDALPRLSPSTLSQLKAGVVQPGYDPSDHGAGIVHLGVGAFHRAHQAVYTDGVLALHGGDWRIAGVSLRSPRVAKQLNPQGGLYTVASKGKNACEYRLIAAIERVIAGASNSHAAIEQMAAPEIKIVSQTITEKGYCRDASTGGLATADPEIVADLNNPKHPRTAVGYIVEALRRRRERGLEGFTVLSCDNLPNNGAAARQVVVEYSQLLDAELSRWIEHEVTFPSSMVDRICPATTAADREAAAKALGLDDQGLVVAEPFSEWVIEDQFCNTRPQWEDVGARMVADVAPYETAKLRLLNGSHSALAYLGCLQGYQFIHEVMSDGAMAASQKLPQRLIATAMDRLDAGQPIPAISLVIAAWIRYVSSEDENGRRRVLDDPLANQLGKLPSSNSNTASEVVDAALGLADIFTSKAAGSAVFRNSLVASLDEILRHGVGAAVRRLCG